MFNWSIYAPYYEEAKKKEQKQIREGLMSNINIESGCDDFLCKFAGTEYCIMENCKQCKLNNCRGCNYLNECMDELMED